MLKIRPKTSKIIQVGIWQREDKLETVWFDEKKQPHFLLTDIRHLLTIAKKIAQQQTNLSNAVKFKFITAIPIHRIWTKTLILPQLLNASECEQQCRFVLENELPIALDELWFDYTSQPLKQGFRLDIFAVMQNVAKAHLELLSPLHIDVLDNAVHCILRTFRYLFPDVKLKSTLFLYQDEQASFALQDKQHQLRLIHKTPQKLTALYAEYCEHYKEMPEQVIFYNLSDTEENLPENWRQAHIDFPFIALGAALWQTDLRQDEISH